MKNGAIIASLCMAGMVGQKGQFSGKLSDSDISTDFINMAMDCEKIIGNKCKLKSPNLTPSVDNISYHDLFCILEIGILVQ
ncbi:MAG: hypothetical protein IPJ02_17620 [Chitinophagaceae bacterium]|nr:hypothetical protein [Chitinophagaceae bacterium]